MGRKLREYHKNGIYHIIQRGNNKTFIFEDIRDKQAFMDIIRDVEAEMPFHMLYYVLMDNHYHFIMEMLNDDISLIMKLINLRYSKYFNKKYNRVGTIFGGRYTALQVNNEKYFIRLIGYISKNPVNARIVQRASDYRWGSDYEIENNVAGLTNQVALFNKLDLDQKRSMEIYHESLLEGPVDYHQLDATTYEFKQYDYTVKRQKDLDHEVRAYVGYDSEKYLLIKSEKRTSERNILRKACAKHLGNRGFTTSEIGEFLDLSTRSVRYLLSH